MRHGDSQLFAAPSFLEMEDHDGSIRQFLEDTGTHNLDGRNTKVRLSHISPKRSLGDRDAASEPLFFSLPGCSLLEWGITAQNKWKIFWLQRMERSTHEELVCFIMLQLLSALKMLQSDGVEALSANFKEFLLAYRFLPVDSQPPLREFPRLIFLPVWHWSNQDSNNV